MELKNPLEVLLETIDELGGWRGMLLITACMYAFILFIQYVAPATASLCGSPFPPLQQGT